METQVDAVANRLAAVVGRIHELNELEINGEIEVGIWERQACKHNLLWNTFRHLIEEVGEVASAIRGKNDEPLENEAVDVAICALALAILQTDGEIEVLLDIFDKKLDKWESNLGE